MPRSIYHVNDVNVHLGRWGGGAPDHISHSVLLMNNELQGFCFTDVWGSSTWIGTASLKSTLSVGGPFPSLSTTRHLSHDKCF